MEELRLDAANQLAIYPLSTLIALFKWLVQVCKIAFTIQVLRFSEDRSGRETCNALTLLLVLAYIDMTMPKALTSSSRYDVAL